MYIGIDLGGTNTVSYTHLDVYKRQPLNQPFSQPPDYPRRVPCYHRVIFKLSADYSSGSDYATVTKNRALQNNAITANKTVFTDMYFPARHQLTISSMCVLKQLQSILCVNGMKVIIQYLAVAANTGVIAYINAFSRIDCRSRNANIVANFNNCSGGSGNNNSWLLYTSRCV